MPSMSAVMQANLPERDAVVPAVCCARRQWVSATPLAADGVARRD